MKWLAVLCLMVILEIPGMVWYKMPAKERERIKMGCLVNYMQKKAKLGFCKFKFFEVNNPETFNWEFHAEPVNELRL